MSNEFNTQLIFLHKLDDVCVMLGMSWNDQVLYFSLIHISKL